MNNLKILCLSFFIISISILNLPAQSLKKANDLFQQGAGLLQQGKYEDSIPYFDQAEEIYVQQNKNNDNSAYTSLWRGIAYYYLFNYEKAIIDFQQAKIKAEIRSFVDVIMSSSLHLANSYYAIDNWSDAYNIYNTTLLLIDKYQSVEYYPSVYEGLGNIDFAWGKYNSAEQFYLKALSYSESLNMTENIINLKIALGRIHHARYDMDKAIDQYNEILEIQDISDSRYYGTILNSLGMAYFQKNEPQTALEYYQKALNIAKNQYNILEEIRLYIHIGGAYHLLEEYEQSIEYYKKALPMALENQRIDDGSRCLFNLGIAYSFLEEYDNAIDYFLRSIDLKEQLRLSVAGESKRDYLAAELKVYQWLATVYLHTEKIEEAVNIMEQASSKYLREQLQQDQDLLKFTGVKHYQERIAENQSIIKLGSVNTQWQSIVQISHSEMKGMYFFHDELLDKLPQSLLVDFRILEENHRGLRVIKPVENQNFYSEMTVEDLIQYYRLLLSSKSNVIEIKEIGRLLYDYFLGPIEENFKGKDHLVIVPDGILAFIPFETLIMPDGRYLIEKYHISYAQSLAIMEIIQLREYKSERKDFLGIGGAIYDTSDDERSDSIYKEIIIDTWQNLPGTLEEIEIIETLFDDSLILSKENASERRIKSLSDQKILENYKIIHFATHGFVLPEEPDLSAIVLSQYNLSGNDGYLNISEISELNIQADFVNLSACETGLGKIYGGEGVVGLAQAFLIAGANSLSVSLWQVSDDSTRDFMTGFYRLYQNEKMTFNQAMTEMKRSFIRSENYNHPYYWAPFVYYGE